MKYTILLILLIACTPKPYHHNYEYMAGKQVPVKDVYITPETVDSARHEYKDPIQDSINALMDLLFPYSDQPAQMIIVDTIPRYIKKKGIYYPYDSVYIEKKKYW